MKITILGAGNVGTTLGERFRSFGHTVTYAVRDASAPKYQQLIKTGAQFCAAETLPDVATESEVIIIALPWDQVEQTLRHCGPLAGKVIIDATNPLELSAEGLQKGLSVGHTTSAGEMVAAWIPNAKVSKAFNTIGSDVMLNPIIDGEPSTLFICGHPDSNKVAMELARELGFAPVEVGDIKLSRLIEPFGMLWIHLRFACAWPSNFALNAVRAKNVHD